MTFKSHIREKYIILGEVNVITIALRRNIRWTTHSYHNDHEDSLIASFNNLKTVLNRCGDLKELAATIFLAPFLEVIRSEDTTGPITGLALSSISKFLSYKLVDEKSKNVALAVSGMADAVTHARFVGTDPANDEVVLMKILQVLRALLLTNIGTYLTNEAVCEIMQSCFRICFEMRLSELLRKAAEHTLVDMVQVLFTRVTDFSEDSKNPTPNNMRKLKMRAGGMGDSGSRSKHKRRSTKQKKTEPAQNINPLESSNLNLDSNTSILPLLNKTTASNGDSSTQEQLINTTDQPIEDFEEIKATATEKLDLSSNEIDEEGTLADIEGEIVDKEEVLPPSSSHDSNVDVSEESDHLQVAENGFSRDINFTNQPNSRGVRFTSSEGDRISGPLIPYSLPCVRELFRFLISLTDPHDRHNSDIMIHIGMSLLMVALEVSRDEIGKFPSLLTLVKGDMCCYLFQLLSIDRLGLVASSLRVSLLLFESLRFHLKFQLESFLKKMMDLITSDNPKMTYEIKELCLEALVQLWHISGLVTELYLNYDCDYYCSNLFEDLSKLLSKNAFPVSGLYTTHLLSLDALLTVVTSIENRCNQRETKTPESLPSIIENEYSPSPQDSQTSDVQIMTTETTSELPQVIVEQEIKIPERFSGVYPTIEELQLIKQNKKILHTGTEYFNQKPRKGITFLQEQNVFATPVDAREVVVWLRANPWLDKKMIGEYISDRRHPEILDNFVRTYKFEGLRIDESLRLYLETFRLPGEAPIIQRLIEAFSSYWSECNHQPFENLDAAFTLSYAIIMLNTDQHNRNVRKQNEPMKAYDFKRNLKGCNGNSDFDQAMLDEVYHTIKNDEIVLPDEQIGPVRDRWLWNVSLRRGNSVEGIWLSAPRESSNDSYINESCLHVYDRDLFAMNWGPTVAALSYVFDKSLDEHIIQKSITGFRKCALISAHFAMCDVFDNLIVSLCKFTTLANGGETPEATAIIFGSNGKAQLAARTVFNLTHCHGDILREGWRNILDIILPLYRAKLLPPTMVEVEDFVDPKGMICLIQEELPMQRSDSSIFNTFYQFMTLGGPTDNSYNKQLTSEDQEAITHAQDCVKELQLETLVTESKFLRLDSLQELIKALMQLSQAPHVHENMSTSYSEDSTIFFFELLLRTVLQNRDRILSLWQMLRDHLYTTIVMSTEYSLLLERAVVGLLRMAIRLLHREDVAEEILASLQILLMIKPTIIHRVSRQIAYGLHELLKTNAANIHSRDDWITIFTVMSCVGAGAGPPTILQLPSNEEAAEESQVITEEELTDQRAVSDSETTVSNNRGSAAISSDRGYTSDGELYEKQLTHRNSSDGENQMDVQLPKLKKSEQKSTIQVIPPPPTPCNQFTLQLGEELRQHDMRSMVKCCETLAFLVRDVAHVTPDNFELCVRCIRTFVEASINGVNRAHHAPEIHPQKQDKKKLKKRKVRDNKRKSHPGSIGGRYAIGNHSDDDTAVENVPGGYHTLSLQLLDLMHTLHTRAASIYSSWAQEEMKQSETQKVPVIAEAAHLWDKCWCPLLQGIARLCCDARRQVRTSALTYLQRALLVHDLQTLTGKEWESCFNKVLFPLLTKLLENISPADPDGMEETRMRGATLLSKVFLQHLTPLLNLPTFTALWLTILDFMDKYMHIGKKDLLYEAIPESLKNMLLVMDTAGVFHCNDTESGFTSLWDVTWERIDCFLPTLKSDVFKPITPEPPKSELCAPEPPELQREGPPALTFLHQTVSPLISPKSNPASKNIFNAAGYISTPLPKLTPPTSLHTPYSAPINPITIGNVNMNVNPGIGPQILTPSSQQPANILMTPSTPNFMIPPIIPQTSDTRIALSKEPINSLKLQEHKS